MALPFLYGGMLPIFNCVHLLKWPVNYRTFLSAGCYQFLFMIFFIMMRLTLFINLRAGGNMDKKELKKLLASLSIVSLVAGAGLSVSGCASTA